QSLVFEEAWDKTIAPHDREKIVETFNQANRLEKEREKFIPLWQACNHRGDLLVAVIIQNFGEALLMLKDVPLTYYEAGQPIATQIFSDSRVRIEPKCSMPWTFIVTKAKIVQVPELKAGYMKEDFKSTQGYNRRDEWRRY